MRLNLSVTWLSAILPHVLSKIDRVSYGLLSKRQLEEADEKTPFSRLVMAVPFVGKDAMKSLEPSLKDIYKTAIQ